MRGMAILFQDKVYVHMPKTGGCWIRDRLRAEPGSKDVVREHTPAHELRARNFEDKALWGTIRDPWSWYASWYNHVMQHPTHTRLAEYSGGSIEFRDVLKGILAGGSAPQLLGISWPFHDETWKRELFVESPIGLYSWVVRYMYGSGIRTLVDMRQMSAGLQELFGLETAKDDYPPVNHRTYKLPPRDMYDDELIQAVYDADRYLVEGLGYGAPFAPAKKAVQHCLLVETPSLHSSMDRAQVS